MQYAHDTVLLRSITFRYFVQNNYILQNWYSMEIQNILRRILKPTKLILQTLEDVNSAATAVSSKVADLLDAGLVLRLVRGFVALIDGLGALAALLDDVDTTNRALDRVSLDAWLVTLNLEGSGDTSSSDSKSEEVLEVHYKVLLRISVASSPYISLLTDSWQYSNRTKLSVPAFAGQFHSLYWSVIGYYLHVSSA